VGVKQQETNAIEAIPPVCLLFNALRATPINRLNLQPPLTRPYIKRSLVPCSTMPSSSQAMTDLKPVTTEELDQGLELEKLGDREPGETPQENRPVNSFRISKSSHFNPKAMLQHLEAHSSVASTPRRQTIQKLIMEDLDRDHDGDITMDEMIGFLDQHITLDKDKKQARKALLVTLLVLFLSVVFNGCASLFANEASKESHVAGGEIVDLSGNMVDTGSPESFADLWDLPSFSSRTLAEMKHLTLVLDDGDEITLDVASVKKTPGSAQATFRSTDGSSIVVDGVARVAMATWQDETFVVQGLAGRRRLADMRDAKLYHAPNFFSQKRGFLTGSEGRHRRLSDSDTQGYAAFALSAGKELLDLASTEHGTAYSSVFFGGKIHMAAGDRMDAEVYYRRHPDLEQGLGSKVHTVNPDGTSLITDHGVGHYFEFDANGDLTLCKKVDAVSNEDSGLSGLAVTVSDDGLQLLLEENGNLMIVDRATLQYDTNGTQIPTPSAKECLDLAKAKAAQFEVNADSPDGYGEPVLLSVAEPAVDMLGDSGGRRLSYAGGEASDGDLWLVAQAAYGGCVDSAGFADNDGHDCDGYVSFFVHLPSFVPLFLPLFLTVFLPLFLLPSFLDIYFLPSFLPSLMSPFFLPFLQIPQ
jgi:hypothetical protein